MSTPDDKPPSDDYPPPRNSNLKKIIQKLSKKHELREYIKYIASYHAAHLIEERKNLQERLLLQGLEEKDLFIIHKFLQIEFDGDLIKISDKGLTKKRANILIDQLI
jgi:hypothetical protein